MTRDVREQIVDDFDVVRLLEEIDQRIDDGLADALDVVDVAIGLAVLAARRRRLRRRRGRPPRSRRPWRDPWPSSRRCGGCRARRGSAQGRCCGARRWPRTASRSTCLPKPLRSSSAREVDAVARLQREDVGRRADQLLVVERLDLLLAQPLDVEGEPRHEMLQALLRLRRADEPAGAAAHDAAAVPRRSSASRTAWLPQTGQSRRETRRASRPSAACPATGPHDLRDDVAGALHDDGVADADVLARDLVLVVQRRVGDDDAADGDRLEPGDRRQRAGAADLDLDVAQHRRRLLGRELVRDGPARRARDEAEPLLQIEPVRPCRRRRRYRSRAWRAARRCAR